jgi:DNA-binding NarL/FixJ family response regulator
MRVLIADDRARSRDGLRALLATCPEVEVVAEAVDGPHLIDLAELYRPDAILTDVRMPRMDGLAATRVIKERWPEIRVVVLTLYGAHRADAIAAGADAFVVKGSSADRLLEAIRGWRNHKGA